MAYTAVPTQSAGGTWDYDDHNTYIRDNFAATTPDVFTAKGDLFIGTGADTGAVLSAGTNGYVHTADSTQTTGTKWASLATGGGIAARYKVGATQTIGSASTTIVQFNTAVYDTADPDAVTTGASWKFTVPSGMDGYYMVCATVYLQSSASWTEGEYCRLELFKGGVLDQYLGAKFVTATGTYNVSVTGMGVISLAATNYIDVRLTQNSGANVVVENDGNFSHIAIARLY